MLNFLSSGNQKQIVGISLTPGIGLQAVVIDKATMSVANYGVKKVEYNFSNREIQNYSQFKSALAELMDEMGIPAKSYVYMVLPNVLFDFIELPPATTDAELKNIFLAKAEEFYIFKKTEPVSGYCEVANIGDQDQKRWAYSSIQKSAIDQIKEITADLGLQLVGIESDYSATLRGMQVTGIIDDMIFENASWTAMLINANNFVLFQMDGKNLINCAEVPLAIRSFSTEEAYDSIVSSASQMLKDSDFSSKLFIISQADEIDAELLKANMDFVGEIVAINTNKYADQPIISADKAVNGNINILTLASIGATCINKKTVNIILNAMADDPNANLGVYFTTYLFGQEVDVTNEFIAKTSIGISILAAIVLGSIIGALALYGQVQSKQLSDLDSKISKVRGDIAKYSEEDKKPEIDITNIIDEIAKRNLSSLRFYDSIASDIPKNIWLTKYYNKDGDKIAVRGVAQNIVDIYGYYKNLRTISPQSDIKLAELKVITDSAPDTDEGRYIESLVINKNVDRLYSFEISNIQVDFTQQQVQHLQGGENQQNEDEAARIRAEEAVIIQTYQPPVEQTSGQMQPAE